MLNETSWARCQAANAPQTCLVRLLVYVRLLSQPDYTCIDIVLANLLVVRLP